MKFTFSIAAAALLAVPAVALQQAPVRPLAQPLTLSVLETRVQARFAQTDVNRDGFVTQAEAQAQIASGPDRAQRAALRQQRQAKRAERLTRLDTDRDGTVSRAERQARVAARGVDRAIRQDRRAQRAERRAERQTMRAVRGLRINERRFTRLDANQDSRLSLSEVTARLAKRFQRLDADQNGEITRDERRAARTKRQARQNG